LRWNPGYTQNCLYGTRGHYKFITANTKNIKKREIKSFLSLLGYYRKFILDFAKITKPMTQQLKVKAAVLLTEQFTKSLEIFKTLLYIILKFSNQ